MQCSLFSHVLSAGVREPAYAFTATTVKSDSPQLHEPIVFTDVLLSEDEVYDVSNGIFTSPTSGTFKFRFLLCIAYGKAMSFQIVADGKVVSRDAGVYNGGAKAVTGNAVVALTKWNKVWVEAYNKDRYGLFAYGSDGKCWNRFTGHILH